MCERVRVERAAGAPLMHCTPHAAPLYVDNRVVSLIKAPHSPVTGTPENNTTGLCRGENRDDFNVRTEFYDSVCCNGQTNDTETFYALCTHANNKRKFNDILCLLQTTKDMLHNVLCCDFCQRPLSIIDFFFNP